MTDPSATWTTVLTTTQAGGTTSRLYTFRKRASATDGGTGYQFNIAPNAIATAAITAWAGVNNSGTVSSAGQASGFNTRTITLPGVTANTLRIGVGEIAANNTFPATCAAGAGCPRRMTIGNASGISSGVYDGFGAGGSTIVTIGGSATRNIGQSISVTQDTTLPSASVVTFPAAAGEYNNTTFNAGCATNGFCGTAADVGSGISLGARLDPPGSRELLERGASFSSAAEVFQTATIAADDVSWSYTFPAANFPAEGSYTLHVLATDNNAQVETPGTSVTFTIDRTVPLSGVLALNSVTPAGRAFLSGSTVWYRGVETGGGNFKIRDTVTDNVGGSGPGGSQTNALGGTTTGWTHTTSTVSTPVGGPFDSNTLRGYRTPSVRPPRSSTHSTRRATRSSCRR